MFNKETGNKLSGLFVLFFVLFTVLGLMIFSAEGAIGGIPVLYMGIFGLWALMILLLWVIIWRNNKAKEKSP